MPQENQEKQVNQVLLVLRDPRGIRDPKDLQEKRCEYLKCFSQGQNKRRNRLDLFF